MVLAPLLLPLCSLEPGSLPASALSRLFKADAGANPADASWAPVTSTWDTAHTSVHTASRSAMFREEEQGDALGSEGKVAGAFGGFRSLEEASGDSGSGSGSGEEGSGAPSPSPPPPSPSPPPPSPSPPPPPSPLAPGPMVVNKTIITVTMTIAGTVEEFDDAKQTTFINGLRDEICNNAACPGVSIALTIAPGSVVVTSEISYREDDASIGASVQTKAEALANADTTSLSTMLGVTVESAPTVTVAKNVAVTLAPPSAPAAARRSSPSPSLPPPASPAKADDDDDGGTPTWLIAVIAVVAVLGVLGLGLFIYKRKNSNNAAGGDYGTEMAKKGDFPVAGIGASTTQHV